MVANIRVCWYGLPLTDSIRTGMLKEAIEIHTVVPNGDDLDAETVIEECRKNQCKTFYHALHGLKAHTTDELEDFYACLEHSGIHVLNKVV